MMKKIKLALSFVWGALYAVAIIYAPHIEPNSAGWAIPALVLCVLLLTGTTVYIVGSVLKFLVENWESE